MTSCLSARRCAGGSDPPPPRCLERFLIVGAIITVITAYWLSEGEANWIVDGDNSATQKESATHDRNEEPTCRNMLAGRKSAPATMRK